MRKAVLLFALTPMITPIVVLVLAFSPAYSQVAREQVSVPEEQLTISTEIETATELDAPRMQGSLRGLGEHLPPLRTPESVVEEVQMNQSRLTHLYKTYRIREAEGIPTRFYGLTLTIASSGTVEKVVVKGPTNPDFIKEIQTIVATWNFSKVMEGKPYVANLKNLDFTFRRSLVLE